MSYCFGGNGCFNFCFKFIKCSNEITNVIVAVNPYEGKLTDDVVKDYYKQYYNLFDGRAFDMGLPDKFTYECCSKYLWDNGQYTVKKVMVNICNGLGYCTYHRIWHHH